MTKSWFGQTVTLKCVADGAPKPTLAWYKPDGSEINKVTVKENTVKVKINEDRDFGMYICTANNGLNPATAKTVHVQKVGKW